MPVKAGEAYEKLAAAASTPYLEEPTASPKAFRVHRAGTWLTWLQCLKRKNRRMETQHIVSLREETEATIVSSDGNNT